MKEAEIIASPSLHAEELPAGQGISYWRDAWYRLRQNKPAMFALSLLAILILGAIFIPYLSTQTYYETHLPLKNTAPGKHFWFGSDELGRDLFTRIWWGARISLFVGISAAIIDMFIGVFYGAFAGMVGGKTEEFMMRLSDILYSLPHLLI